MNQLSEYEQKALQKFGESVMNGKWSNEGLVKLVQSIEQFINPIPIQKYAESLGMTYNGIKKQNKLVELFGKKYILDNQ